MDSDHRFYTAMLVENGKITALFDETPQIDCEKINLQEKTVIPGLTDTHTHSFEGGLYDKGADLSLAESIPDVLDILHRTKPQSGMIFAWQFDENNIREKRFPTFAEINQAVPDHPLLFRRIDGHSCMVNQKAFECIPWKQDTDPTQVLKGFVNDEAAHWFHRNLDEESIINAYQNACTIGMKNGVTCIHTMIGDANQSFLHFPLISHHLNRFPIRIIPYPQTFNINEVLKTGVKRIGGCILADGSFGSHTAALSEPFYDQPDNYGSPYHDQQFWDDFILSAHLNDLQTGVHCIGDYAVEQLITAIEKAQNQIRKDLRHQIIHCELISDAQIERMAQAGISAVMQPMFDRRWGGIEGFYTKVLGHERAQRTTRLNSLIKAGVLVTGGSDWYITDLNPLKGIHAAVNIHYPQERLSVYEAVKLFTVNAAKLAFLEKQTGQLSVGYDADFICLNKNIFETDDLLSVKCDQVYFQGKNVFSG